MWAARGYWFGYAQITLEMPSKNSRNKKKYLIFNSGLGDGGFMSKTLTNKVKLITEHHPFPKLLHAHLFPEK